MKGVEIVTKTIDNGEKQVSENTQETESSLNCCKTSEEDYCHQSRETESCVNKQQQGEEEQEQEEDQSSPRGVLEISISGSDSDRSISIDRSSSFDSENNSSPGEAVVVVSSNLQWKKLFGQIKKSSVMKLSNISFLGGYRNDLFKKGGKRNLGRNHSNSNSSSTEEELAAMDSGDLVIPKPSWKNFTFQELQQATDSFSPDKLIGKGGHAEVYKGCLPDGEVVAVKKIMKREKSDEDRVGDFLSELGIIAHIDHPNAAKLVGFSVDNGLHLVLQFLPHGSLSTVLHGCEENLEWAIRYKVALGVAEGLHYLHSNCPRRIIHRDITASNILLSEDYEAQISDFGLAKWLPEKWVHHIVSPIEGTFGYMAPEYFMHGVVHEKTDVFAFGVLLLELITGRRAVDSSRQSLVMWAKPLLEKNSVKEIADPKLKETYNVIEMKRAMYTASTCIHHLPNLRPNMKRVVQLLSGENEPVDIKQKSMGGRALFLDACDLEDYTCTTYLKDLNRHMELVME